MVQLKFTKGFLAKLEDIFSESNYILRYEKGDFKSGYCILKDKQIVIINKYYSLEGKVNSLVDILKQLELDTRQFSEKNLKLYTDIQQNELG